MISLQAGSGGRSTKQRSQHLLRSGENHLRIVVYNSATNRLVGRALPDYRLLNSRYGQRFTPQDVEGRKPLPSGLLRGPPLLMEERR